MTLDHVAPRRGQTAYDRRDNLVLACHDCNAAKRDLAPLAFLLGKKSRAANLLKFGAHLSAGLLDLARSLVRGQVPAIRSGEVEHDDRGRRGVALPRLSETTTAISEVRKHLARLDPRL